MGTHLFLTLKEGWDAPLFFFLDALTPGISLGTPCSLPAECQPPSREESLGIQVPIFAYLLCLLTGRHQECSTLKSSPICHP